MSQKQTSARGWNWGTYVLNQTELEFQVENKNCFSIPYNQIAISSATGKNEVTFEFAGDAEQTKGDILCEIRFHVPNNELEKLRAEKEKEDENEDGDEESVEEKTAANIFNDRILEKANISQVGGSVIASVRDLPMQTPRGNYSLDFYSNFAKMHGKTHDFKIMYKDISKVFLLQENKGEHMAYLIQLDQPLRIGQQLHHFISIKLKVDRQEKIKVNLKEEDIKAKYGDNLQVENEGTLYDVLTKLFNNLAGIKKFLVPGGFRTSRDQNAISCNVKQAEGYLYPLKSSLVFIYKPVMYIKHSELRYVEFGRTGGNTTRTFDLTLTKLKDDQRVTFVSIEKDEYKTLVEYFKASNVQMKNIDTDGKQSDLKETPSKGDQQMIGDDDEESDDESFNDKGPDGSDDDEEDSEDEDFSDADGSGDDDEMSELDKMEIKDLVKDAGADNLGSKRPPRRAARK